MAQETKRSVELAAIYIGDPMCSWCWGFVPASTALAQAIKGRAALRVVPDGLPQAEFAQSFDEAATHDALDAELDLVHDLGIQSFPAVALRSGQRIRRLTLGYRAWPELVPHVQNWLQQEQSESIANTALCRDPLNDPGIAGLQQ